MRVALPPKDLHCRGLGQARRMIDKSASLAGRSASICSFEAVPFMSRGRLFSATLDAENVRHNDGRRCASLWPRSCGSVSREANVTDRGDGGGAAGFFDEPMYQVALSNWPRPYDLLEDPVNSAGDARLEIWTIDPQDLRPVPPAPADGSLVGRSTTFSVMNSGNYTLRVPKKSWKIDVELGDDDDDIAGMKRLNLKAMYNDPAQMREALAWGLFADVGIPAPQHTYARLAINGAYRGLFSLIEQVEKRFLKLHFGDNFRGNLYKAYAGDVGQATIERLVDDHEDDSGRQYFRDAPDGDRTYRLKTNEDNAELNTYDDLAMLARTVGDRTKSPGWYASDAFASAASEVVDVHQVLRWAGVNILLGSWDNYFATAANYYLYNGGRLGESKAFDDKPFFSLIPWDYDNCFGIDYFTTAWQYTDLLDWPANTVGYWRKQGTNETSRIPLVENLLANHDFAQYYLDFVEFLLDTVFTPAKIAATMGTTDGEGLWPRVCQSAYLESDTPYGAPFTGRRFSNDEVYWSGYAQHHLDNGGGSIEGIYHYTRMRYDSARQQLDGLRTTYPSGASGAQFALTRAQLALRV